MYLVTKVLASTDLLINLIYVIFIIITLVYIYITRDKS